MFITSPFFSNIVVLSRAVCFSAVFYALPKNTQKTDRTFNGAIPTNEVDRFYQKYIFRPISAQPVKHLVRLLIVRSF